MKSVSQQLATNQAGQINAAHERFIDAARQALEHAIEAGRLLSQVKAGLNHGEWIPWIEANCRFAVRTAQRYVQIYDHRDAIEGNAQRATHLSIRQAVKKITDQRGATSLKGRDPATFLPDRFAPPDSGFVLLERSTKEFAVILGFVEPHNVAEKLGGFFPNGPEWADVFIAVKDAGNEDGCASFAKRGIHVDDVSSFLSSVVPLDQIKATTIREPAREWIEDNFLNLIFGRAA